MYLFDCNLLNLHLGSDVISWRESLKYLGLSFKAGKTLTVDITASLLKFYMAANSICSHTNYVSEVTKLFLVESYRLLLITYGCETLNFNSHIIHQLSVCAGTMHIGGFFYYNSWESVKALQFYCGQLDFYHVYVK